MDTATSLRPAAVRTSTTPTATAIGTTPRPTPGPLASTSTAIISTVPAIILARVPVTGTTDSVITEGLLIILGVSVIGEVGRTVVIIATITIFIKQAENKH